MTLKLSASARREQTLHVLKPSSKKVPYKTNVSTQSVSGDVMNDAQKKNKTATLQSPT